MYYTLLIPTKDRVKQFNSFWAPSENTEWNTLLFEGGEEVRITDYIKKKEFELMQKHDNEIKVFWRNKEVDTFLQAINSIYHTRLATHKIIELLNHDMSVLTKKHDNDLMSLLKTELSLEEFIAICRKATGKNAYSFATKVYSFARGEDHPTEYPIIDSYVATLLEYYLEQSKKDWGCYSKFKEAYNAFVTKFQLDGFSYKEIDIFLWTYGTAIQKYWKNQGVLTFESVQYKQGQYSNET